MGKPIENLLWSIAIPGFGQLLNGKYIRGLLFVGLEFLINVQSHFNQVIALSFQGRIGEAIEQTNYQWLMFYPCLYMFALWDAFKDAGGGRRPYSFIPFALAAYLETVGIIYSDRVKLFGVLWGPIWLTILCCFIGLAAGGVIQFLLLKWTHPRRMNR